MIFERFEDKGLAQYSYLLACERAGEAIIVDPQRDIDGYLDFAGSRGLRISHVLETHIHADFASGARELAERTRATLSLSAYDAGETYQYGFPHRDLRDGDAVEVGAVRVMALHTPGHTPEHLSFLVYDQMRARHTPMALLSGDFLLVGSVGRPDLLGDEATSALAERLFASVRDVLSGLPDGLEIAPGHGAGSMCGAGMSSQASSTLGFERVANPYLAAGLSRDAFVDRLLSTAPPFPDYYRRMKRFNADGPPLLMGLPGLGPLDAAAVGAHVDAGGLVVDLHDQVSFGRAHIPGSFGIGAGTSVSTWASWVVPPARPIVLVAGSVDEVEPAVRGLVRVGLDEVVGYLDGGVAAWRVSGRPLATLPQLRPQELHSRRATGEAWRVLDVRTMDEWRGGHIAGAQHLMAGELGRRLHEVPHDAAPIAVVCGTGYRSTVASSVLERAGYRDIYNVTGGMAAWRQAGLPEDLSMQNDE